MHERLVRNRLLRAVLVTLPLFLMSGNGISQMGTRCRTDALFIEMLKAQSAFREFEQTQIEMDQWKQRERQRIPAYNIELSKAVVEFHHHISDMHYQHVSCKICREHVKKIKEWTKKIDQAMK